MILLMTKHDQDEEWHTTICTQFIRSLWQGASRRDNHDTPRLIVVWNLLAGGLIITSKLGALMQRLFLHFSTDATAKNATVFLNSICEPEFLTMVTASDTLGSRAAQHIVLYEVYSGLCRWYLRLQTQTVVASEVKKSIKVWDRNRASRLLLTRNSELRELRQQIKG